MKTATFHINTTQISRCEKKLFFQQITTFALKNMEVRQAVHAQFCFEILRFLEHVKKVVNKNW